MLDLEQLQILAQIMDNIEVLTGILEKSYENNNGEEFNKSKGAILDFQKKIGGMIKQNEH
jgi:hypothetical protein